MQFFTLAAQPAAATGGDVINFAGGFHITVPKEGTAFSIGSMDIKWYGILIAIGFLLAVLYALKRSREFSLNADTMLDVIIGGTIGAVVFARIYYVIFSWNGEEWDFLSIFNIRKGGIAIYGAIIGGFLVAAFVCKWRKVNYRAMFDISALGFLIGQCIGRWGNFFNQEAFGRPTKFFLGMWSETIEKTSGGWIKSTDFAHPTFLYESLWCLAGFILLHFISKKFRKFDGQIFLMYGIWYGFGRFFIEELRMDSLMFFSFRVSQLVSLAVVITCLVLLIKGMRKIKVEENPDEYTPLFVTEEELLEQADAEAEDTEVEPETVLVRRKKKTPDSDN